jgi:nucleoside-diphosphate-sugar epimerase
MKYLITGGAGFIGSHLTNRLLKDGHRVVIIDDLSEGILDNVPLGDLSLGFYEKSILGDIFHAFENIDCVFHLAALTRPQESIKHPERYNETNVRGTLRVLLHARKNKVRRVVFASSSSLYGGQEEFPTSEDAEPNPMSPYASQKLIGEEYCKLFNKIYGLEVNCIRPFNIYGSRMNPDSSYAALIPGFIKKYKNGVRPTINGSGKNVRDFVWIDDVIEIFIRASKCKVSGEAFNAGSGVNASVNEVSEMIRRALKTKIKPTHGPAVIEPRATMADMNKVKRILDYEPKMSLERGIRRICDYY